MIARTIASTILCVVLLAACSEDIPSQTMMPVLGKAEAVSLRVELSGGYEVIIDDPVTIARFVQAVDAAELELFDGDKENAALAYSTDDFIVVTYVSGQSDRFIMMGDSVFFPADGYKVLIYTGPEVDDVLVELEDAALAAGERVDS